MVRKNEVNDWVIVGAAAIGLYALYKWKTRNNMTPDEKDAFFSKVEGSKAGTESKLQPKTLLLPIEGGVAKIDPTELNAYQKWYIEHNWYQVEGDFLKPAWWLNPITASAVRLYEVLT